ncbi:6-bladed beta-propeller [Rhodohalobacter halophilus]|uniref:6-bladed beta-propeller n=1 Tax=Rhodohalobacter halophilus TaxID=1812810 RepID=UPI00083FAC37|nr:6-bladed beta-propeller [Rhodohalobacter halophilus]
MLIYTLPILTGFLLFNTDLALENPDCSSSEIRRCLNQEMISSSFQTIRFVKDQVFGDTDTVFLGRIWDVDVDSENRVYIADAGNVTIHVYDYDGSYETSIGRQGRGPGEFPHITQHTRIHAKQDELFVTGTEWMFSNNVQVFSLNDYSLSGGVLFRESDKKKFSPQLENYFPRSVYPLENEKFLVAYEQVRSPEYLEGGENKIMYYLHDQNGAIVGGPILEQKDRTYLYQVHQGIGYNYYAFPFYGKSIFTVSEDGYLYTAFSDEFRIDVRATNGEIVRSIEHSFNPIQTTRRELIGKYERIDMSRLDFNEGDNMALQMIREAENLPDVWPVMNEILIDNENRIWVSTIVENFDIYEWWVLENTGEVITKFDWPRNKPIEVVKNGYMYTRQTDAETGLQQVVRYRIEFEE